MRKAYKNIISLSVILIAGLNLLVPAFAQDPFSGVAIGGLTGASGAGLFGSMASASGINIGWGNNTVDEMDAMWNTLNPDHVYFSGEKHEANPQTEPEDIYDYITVDIGDWLSAQSDFIVNFAQTFSVDDNDSGTTPNTVSLAGVPMSYSGGTYYTTNLGPITDGSTFELAGSYIHFSVSGSRLYYDFKKADGSMGRDWVVNSYLGTQLQIKSDLRTPYVFRYTLFNTPIYIDTSLLSLSSSVDWTSDSVNTSVYDGWESARVKIPHSISGLSPNWTIPDFTNALNNLWLQNQQSQIVIEDTDQPVPPPPVPSTPLGDVPFDDWVDLWGQGIYQQLENQSDTLDFIGSNGEDAVEELESIDSNLDDLVGTAESIDTNIGIGNGLLGGIKSAIESGVDFLEGIAEHVGELVEEIVEGTETLIAGILNQIPSVFGVIFGPIKQASSIWHYVVEWIQSISAPMSWMITMANGTSYYIVLPVYASLAGAVVLAFYKRFGK